MFNPLDMLLAQNGAGMQTVAQQFGLTPDQTRRALDALMPAFALGLQRAPAGDPAGLSQMFGLPGARAPKPAETMLGGMFGSPALTQAILQQASTASGVGAQALRQMLPMMAGAVVASIVHVMLNQQAPEPAPAPASPFPVNPIWAEMMRAFLPPADAAAQAGARQPSPRPQPAESKTAEPKTAEPGRDMFQQMLRTGAEVQEQNVKAMQGLFEAFWAKSGPGASPSAASSAAGPPETVRKARKGQAPTR